jgi:hypothetical protein
MKSHVLISAICLSSAALMLQVPPVHADTLTFAASLFGANENPPVNSPGTGNVTVVLDTIAKTLLASSFLHAFITNNGGTAAAAALVLINGIENGLSYFNIHTVNNGGGEIRGQLAAGPLPGLCRFSPPASACWVCSAGEGSGSKPPNDI